MNDSENKNIPPETNQPEDDFVIGKGFTVSNDYEEPEPDLYLSPRVKEKKSGGVLKSVLWIIAIVVVAVGIAFGVIFAGADYLGIGFGRGNDCTMEIAAGTPTVKIAKQLKETGAVQWPFLFRLYSKLKHYDSQYKYGVYNFNTEAGYEALAQMLMTEGAKIESVTVTIPEMSTVDEIADLLEQNKVCTKSDFINEVQNGDFHYDFIKDIPQDKVFYRLEGYLFPDTYNFYNYDSAECAHLAVDRMLKSLEQKIDSNLKSKIENSKYSFHELMTLASIVELEAGGSPAEMSNVAAVFYARLASPDFAKLESSPTQKYPHGGGRYDTYQCLGLPPGPLCSPSLNSIRATLLPTENFAYYFFVTDAKMNFYYTKTLSEHNATINRLKKENNWIGDR
ncbi:MAG: endolytic transglycosylase MltG [Clostridia bacterium]|nr:endolytic transglycosylase MltG [Clostridia bacterium]